eukprot:11161937-Lingulodinium_polyedra.AAC.1
MGASAAMGTTRVASAPSAVLRPACAWTAGAPRSPGPPCPAAPRCRCTERTSARGVRRRRGRARETPARPP